MDKDGGETGIGIDEYDGGDELWWRWKCQLDFHQKI